MAEPAASHHGRISALLKKMPTETAFKFVEAVGFFAPLSPLIDRAEPQEPDASGAELGRVSSRSLPPIWRWLSQTVAPDIAARLVETVAKAAIGSQAPSAGVVASLPGLREELGRAAAAAFENSPFDDIVEEIGSQRAARDALLVARALVISDTIERVRALALSEKSPLPPDVIEIVREVAEREPDSVAALACLILGQIGRAADIVPVVLALAKRRDENRLDKSALAPAMFAAIEIACGRGARDLRPGAPPRDALAAAQRRSREIAELSTALRGHVTEEWTRRLHLRVGQIDRVMEALCIECLGVVRHALTCPEPALNADGAALAADAAAFLIEAKPIGAALRFEKARRRALSEVVHELDSPAADAAEERLRALAIRSPADAERYVELRARLVEAFQDAGAARAWSRRGRRIIGRPTFAEIVLGVVEPVIADDDGARIRDGQIEREFVEALWSWAGSGPLKSEREIAETGFAAEREREPRVAFERVVKHRQELAQAARSALERESGFAPTIRGDVRAQLAAFSALLGGEREIRARLESWPARVKHVVEEHIVAVRELHDALAATTPEVEPSLLILVMGRLERPWHVLRMLDRIARTNNDTLIEATEFVAVGEILIDRAEADARCFRPARGEPIHADKVLAALERFAGVASGMTEEFQIRRNGRWGSRLYTLKTRAARDLEEMCKSAMDVVNAVTPRVSHAGGKWSADVSRPIDESEIATAAQFARFLRGSKVLDHRAAFAGARTNAMSRIDARLTSQVEALLTLAHSGESRDEALAHLRALAAVVGEFEGREAGEIVLRRAAAAA
jgi:hypothetical protein